MQDKKTSERKSSPLESTETTREVYDGNRARVLYARDEVKPLRVIYSDGTTAEFKYDSLNTLVEIVERNGIGWVRETSIDPSGLCWRSSDGQLCKLRFAVLPDGTYQRQDPSGVIETITTSLKRLVSRPFARGFDPAKTLAELFKEIDRNGDRTLTRTELDSALSDLCANRDHVQLIAMLRHYFDDLIQTRDDPLLIEAGGLTVEDVVRFEKIRSSAQQKMLQPPAHFVQFYEDIFERIDTDRDGMTNLQEIEQVCAEIDPRLQFIDRPTTGSHLCKDSSQSENSSGIESGAEKAHQTQPATASQSLDQGGVPNYSLIGIVYKFLQDNEDLSQFDIHEKSDWVYKKNFIQICDKACFTHAQALMIKGGWYYDEQKSASQIPRNIFADPSSPSESVRVEAVRQGTLGDPVFLATLAGAVAANPPSILKSLAQNAPKTCTVTFPGASDTPVTMSWLTALELSLFQHGTEYGIWCAFMQKAYETYLALTGLPRSLVPNGTQEVSDGTNIPFGLLLNKRAEWRYFKNTNEEELRHLITQHHQLRLPVLLATGPLESWIGGVRIHPSHVMALIRVNKDTGMAIVRDPLASAMKKSPGAEHSDGSVLTISLEQVVKHFLAISIAL